MITAKEEFLTHDKTQRAIKLAGYEVLAMWMALKGYAATHATDGFVPDEDIDTLPGAPPKARKALKALVDCGRILPTRERGPGLVVATDGGWQLHDYLDHANSSDAEFIRRERARLQKAARRAALKEERLRLEALTSGQRDTGQSAKEPDMSADNAGQNADKTGGQTPDSPAPVPPPARGRTRDPQPNPTQPGITTTTVAAPESSNITCPAPDAALSPATVGALTMGLGMTEADVARAVKRAYVTLASQAPRRAEQWDRTFATVVRGMWDDPEQRRAIRAGDSPDARPARTLTAAEDPYS